MPVEPIPMVLTTARDADRSMDSMTDLSTDAKPLRSSAADDDFRLRINRTVERNQWETARISSFLASA